MNEAESQPDVSGNQEAAVTPVAEKLGLLDQDALMDIVKSGFLDEKEEAPSLEEQHDESEEVESASAEESTEDDESDQPNTDEGQLSKGIQKRINKLVAAKKAAQAKLEAQESKLGELQRELEQVKLSKPKETQKLSNYVQGLDTLEKVQKEHENAVEVLMWCEQNPDGGTIQTPNGEVDLSYEDVRNMKQVALKRKEIELPKRYQFLQTQQNLEASVAADFPWWGRPDAEEYIAAQEVLREFPEIKERRADWKHVAGLVVLGMKAYLASKEKKAAPPIKRAPSQPGVSKAPPANTSVNQNAAKAREKFLKSNGSSDGLNDLVKAMGFV